VRHVCVTGGEPLAQKSCLALLVALCDAGFSVSLETSGAMDVAGVDPRVSRVVDLKTPGSGEHERNRLANLEVLTARDQVKVVVCSRADYEWARDLLRNSAPLPCQVLVSPSWGQLEPRELAEWILADRLDVRLQVQLHKILWGNEPGPMSTQASRVVQSSRPCAVVLVSGGLDSATCLAIARAEGYDCYALSFAYGQRHEVELAAAARVAHALAQSNTASCTSTSRCSAARRSPTRASPCRRRPPPASR